MSARDEAAGLDSTSSAIVLVAGAGIGEHIHQNCEEMFFGIDNGVTLSRYIHSVPQAVLYRNAGSAPSSTQPQINISAVCFWHDLAFADFEVRGTRSNALHPQRP